MRASPVPRAMTDDDKKKIRADFKKAVNMTPAEIADWLETDESKKVGFKGKDGSEAESVGHKSGRRIVAILRSKQADLTDDDYSHMREVVGYVARHAAQKPENQITSRWLFADELGPRSDKVSRVAEGVRISQSTAWQAAATRRS